MKWLNNLFARRRDGNPAADIGCAPAADAGRGGNETTGQRIGNTGDELQALISCASEAVITLIQERILMLPDADIRELIDAVQNSGRLTDISGNLLPSLSSRMANAILIAEGNSVRFQRVLSVISILEVQSCIHGRSMIADALDRIALHARSQNWSSPQKVRQFIKPCLTSSIYWDLVERCNALRSRVQKEESSATHPPRGDPWWGYQFYEPINAFEAFGQKGIQLRKQRDTSLTGASEIP